MVSICGWVGFGWIGFDSVRFRRGGLGNGALAQIVIVERRLFEPSNAWEKFVQHFQVLFSSRLALLGVGQPALGTSVVQQ